MGNLVVKSAEVQEAIHSAKIIEDSLQRTHEKCQAIISYVHSAKWSGETRNAFLTYMEIIEKYHGDVNKVFKKQREALQHVNDYIMDFENSSISKEVKNI